MSKSHGIVSTGDFLSQKDSSLSEYTALLMNKGFSTTQTLAHLSISDIPEIPLGLRRLLIHEVGKLHSPLNRQLLNRKDCNSDNLLGGVNNFQSDSPIIISDDSNSRSMVLRPKQLFPSRNSGDNFVALSAYQYQSPMEKHLSTVLTEISQKELEIETSKPVGFMQSCCAVLFCRKNAQTIIIIIIISRSKMASSCLIYQTFGCY